MSNRVNIDISANVTGYVQGLNKATQSAKQYDTETRKISDNTINLNQKLREAKKAARDLAVSYRMLSDEEKNSRFGLEMKRQLDAAMKSASNLLDVQKDVQRQIQNMASDTKVWDTLGESIGVIGGAASTAMGAIAQFTGNEEDARKAVVMFTTAQSACTTIQKAANLVQKESNLMLGIAAIQEKAAAAAIEMKAAAEGKNAVATGAATIAQKAFNMVAKANPYVLLVTAIVAVTGAVGAYIAISNKAKKEEEERLAAIKAANAEILHRRENEKAMSEEVASSAAKQLVAYDNLKRKWDECGGKVVEQKKFLKEYKKEIEATGYSVNDLSSAEEFFVNNTDAVKQAIIERAKAQAAYNLAVKEMEKGLKDLDKKTVGTGAFVETFNKKPVTAAEQNYAISILGDKTMETWTDLEGNLHKTFKLTDKAKALIMAKRNKDAIELNKQYKKTVTDSMNERVSNYLDLMQEYSNKEKEIQKKYGLNTVVNTSSSGSDKKDKNDPKIEAAKGSLNEMKKDLNEMQQALANGLIPEKSIDQTISNIEQLKAKIEAMEIRLGFKADTSDEKIQKMVEEFNKKVEAIQQKKEGISMTPKFSAFDQAIGKTSFDTSTLDGLKQQMTFIENLIPQLEELKEMYKELGEAGASGVDDVNTAIKNLSAQQAAYAQQAAVLNQQEIDKKNKAEEMQELSDSLGTAAKFAGQLGSAMGSMADAIDDKGLKTAAIIAQAIASVLSGAAQAIATAGKLGPLAWIGFSLGVMGTAATVVSQIKSLSKFADGGIVGDMVRGTSSIGDNNLVRVNSGEMILNGRQQANLFGLLDSNKMPGGSESVNVHFTGMVRGTDLLLVQQNTNRMLSQAGNQIYLNF